MAKPDKVKILEDISTDILKSFENMNEDELQSDESMKKFETLDKLIFSLYKDFKDVKFTDVPKFKEVIDIFLKSKYSTQTSIIIEDLTQYLEPKKVRGYYLDKFDRRISYEGNRKLKSANTEMNLELGHQVEIYKCMKSLSYFRANYVFIKTKKGIDRPELREYQKRTEDTLLEGHDVLLSFPRQSGKCVTSDTYIDVKYKDVKLHITLGAFYYINEILEEIKERKVPLNSLEVMNIYFRIKERNGS